MSKLKDLDYRDMVYFKKKLDLAKKQNLSPRILVKLQKQYELTRLVIK